MRPTRISPRSALAALIDQENPGSTIIFCNTREDTSSVANYLDRQGFDVMLISGDLNQRKREQVIQSVKGGSVQFLVATDVASRGIDIRDITHVIHYGLPQDPAVYLHRAGRTGRIGKEGASLALASPSDTGTRKVLETRFNIKFESADLPSTEEAKRLRVERQIARIKAAAGSAAFESYLALVRDLKEREDGDLLLATVMRGFFLWEREQRTRLSKPEPKERSREDRPRRGRG